MPRMSIHHDFRLAVYMCLHTRLGHKSQLHQLDADTLHAIILGIEAEAEALAAKTTKEYQQQAYMRQREFMRPMSPSYWRYLDLTLIQTFTELERQASVLSDKYNAERKEEPPDDKLSIPVRMNLIIRENKRDAALKASVQWESNCRCICSTFCPHRPDILRQLAAACCLKDSGLLCKP
jgi:hypothetical protein